jgi:DNA-binding beta-propeller fold protein YncE
VPWGVRHDRSTGRLLVVDGALGNLYVLKGTGAEPSPGMLPGCGLLQTVAVGPAAAKPHELAVDPSNGDLYVANVGTPTGIVRLARTG